MKNAEPCKPIVSKMADKIGACVKKEIAAGKPQKQAVAIAYKTAGK